MWKEVPRTRKKEVLSSHLISSSHVSHSRQSASRKVKRRQWSHLLTHFSPTFYQLFSNELTFVGKI